ncbi:hypothetical protein G7Y79_00021g051120 [Physcia stellaris]|nr:hypothetical protein G7Y79_00021g051120 [Physcia stellaris]
MSAVPPSVRTQNLSSSVDGSEDVEIAQDLSSPFPYEFPYLGNVSDIDASRFPMPQCNGIAIEEATIDQLQDSMSRKKLTTIMELNPDFMQIAAALDAERAAGVVRGPLHGIPFLVKDNMATKDKMETTAGSWMLLGSVVPRDAHVVARLRKAGALLLGKATMSEWADMRSSNYSEGYSARGGQARSPYNLTINPGGSSSGSAAAVAANICMFALGTETDGSVINPAERNALVGIKPTVGLTSRAGQGSVVPESVHQDTVGTFSRTVRDGVYALDAIYGIDKRYNHTKRQIGKTPAKGYSQFITSKDALVGAAFGLPWKSFWVLLDEVQRTSLLELIRLVQEAGATIINGTELPDYERIVSPDGWDWQVDFYNNIKSYLGELENTGIRSLEDIVRYNIDNVGTEGGLPNIQPAFISGQDSFLASLATKGIMDETYHQALNFCQSSTRENGIDAALHHEATPPVLLHGLLVPPDIGQTYQIAAQAGYPMITLPAGVSPTTGMPFGLALMNTAWSEPTLIRYASAIEDLQASLGKTYGRTRPKWYGWRQRNIPVLNL